MLNQNRYALKIIRDSLSYASRASLVMCDTYCSLQSCYLSVQIRVFRPIRVPSRAGPGGFVNDKHRFSLLIFTEYLFIFCLYRSSNSIPCGRFFEENLKQNNILNIEYQLIREYFSSVERQGLNEWRKFLKKDGYSRKLLAEMIIVINKE